MNARIESARYHRSPGAAVALTVVALTFGVWTVLASPLFAVKRIDVTGVRHLDQDTIRQLAGVPLGTNVLRVPVSEAVGSLEGHPWIAGADVLRNLPTGITISVQERRPVGWVSSTEAQGAALLSADARVLEVLDFTRSDLPLLGETSGPLTPGAAVPWTSALRLAASMPSSLLERTEAVGEVLGEMTVDLRTGERVDYGAPGEYGVKNDAVLGMLAWAGERGISVAAVDVSIPEAPTLTRSTFVTA